MTEYAAEKIRNVSLVSHSGAGKTTLAEALMFVAGSSHRLGNVDEGNTISDFNQDEINRKISINSSLMHLEWNKNKVNLIDNPGYIDFIGEVYGSLHVTENAVLLAHSVSGVEVGTELYWNMIQEKKNSCVFFINQLDKEHADFDKVVTQIKETFHHNAIPIQLPIDPGLNFKGVIDLLSMKAVYFDSNTGKSEKKDIPAELKEKADEARLELIESAAECDEQLMEKYLEEGELTDDELRQAILAGVKQKLFFPVLCGAANTLIGVQNLLDFIVNDMPSPAVAEMELLPYGKEENEAVKVGEDEKSLLFIFKTLSEHHVGELSFFKVMSGTIHSGQELLNSSNQSSERAGQMYFMKGKERKEVSEVGFGDIAALVKLKHTHTNNTLADKKFEYEYPKIEFPAPKIRSAVLGKNQGDEDKITAGFNKLHEENPTFISKMDAELKQILIFGQGELQLEIICQRLKDRFNVEVELVKPKIPYREAIRGKKETRYKYKKQSGGRGQYGDVNIIVEPLERGGGFEFVDAIVGGAIPGKYVPAVEKGVKETMEQGILAGCKVVDLKVTLNDGSYHSVDSSDMAFKIAASQGLKKAFVEAKPILLEPIENIEVTVPEEFMGDVMGDISSRRGKIMGMEARGHFQLIKGQVPLSELYRYSTSLRSMTQGRGLHTQSFSHYEEVPRDLVDKIIEESKKDED